MPTKNQIIEKLVQSLNNSIENSEFKWEKFFDKWYRQNGTPLFFLFKKNLSVTNTQYNELFSLLNFYREEDSPIILFHSTVHLRTAITDLMNIVLEDYSPFDNKRIQDFAIKNIDIFISSAPVDMFFGSCSVFLPIGLSSKIDKVIHDSGYIHSGGKSIYIRNIKKARKNEFLENLKNYLLQNDSTNKIPFVVYSHEDFSNYDSSSSEYINKGIESLKIYVEKMDMGRTKLPNLLNEIASDLLCKEKLILPDPGNYKTKHSFESDKTIWLISDRSISSTTLNNSGQNRFYILYEQVYKNGSPFFFFDENKPGWKSHTTMPHSLTAALLNIAKSQLVEGPICDPFGGTGTTWFEAKRIGLNNEIVCSDLNILTHILIEDNLSFFCKDFKELLEIKKEIEHISNFFENPQTSFNFSSNLKIESHKVYMLFEELKNNESNKNNFYEFDFDNDFLTKFKGINFEERILFYLIMKSYLRYYSAFSRKSMNFEKAFEKSKNDFLKQIGDLIDLKQKCKDSFLKNENHITTFQSHYSLKITSSLFNDKNNFDNLPNEIFSLKNATDLEENFYSLILCDPPYGFNTIEDENSLVDLYNDFIFRAIKSLKPFGQLIICLPGESYTGKELPYCTKSNLISRKIMIVAESLGRVIISRSKSIPNLNLNPPYYWEADKALKRTILHFTFY
ncbi:MAG: hypothetical protein LCH67_06135 [Bacteroidetes bacterium]|nr:hypothetical protein [Bacteroidota bacterium]